MTVDLTLNIVHLLWYLTAGILFAILVAKVSSIDFHNNATIVVWFCVVVLVTLWPVWFAYVLYEVMKKVWRK